MAGSREVLTDLAVLDRLSDHNNAGILQKVANYFIPPDLTQQASLSTHNSWLICYHTSNKIQQNIFIMWKSKLIHQPDNKDFYQV